MRQLPWESVAGSGGEWWGGGGLGGGRGATLQPAAAWRLAQVAENQYGSGSLIGPDSGRAAECGNIGERHTRPRWMTERREVVGEGQRSGGLGVRGRKHALRMMDEKTRTQRSDTRAQFMSCGASVAAESRGRNIVQGRNNVTADS